jgi:hypothetical protein
MMSLRIKSNFCCQLLAMSLVLITSQAWAYVPVTTARGESTKAIKTTAEIRFNSDELDSLHAKIEYSYTELTALGLVVIYQPKLNVLPWAPTALKQYEMDFAATAFNQKTLCETLGYTQSVVEDLKTQNDGYTGRDLTAKLESGSHVRIDREVNMLRVQAVSKHAGGKSTKTMPVIKRLVCLK